MYTKGTNNELLNANEVHTLASINLRKYIYLLGNKDT